MERMQLIGECLKDFRYKWMKMKIQECNNKSLCNIQEKVEQVLLSVKRVQEQSDAPSLCFVSLFHFRSSVWTGSYRYQICASDDTLYLSRPLASSDFVPEQIYNDVERLRNEIEIELKKQFVRLTSHEIDMAVNTLLLDYQQLVEVYWSQVARKIAKSEMFAHIRKAENWKFLSGTYMDELNIVLKSEKRR